MSNTNPNLELAKEALEESGKARVAASLDLANYYLAVARTQAAIAAVEEQRTANLIAAYNGDLLKNPHPIGTHEHDIWWAKTAGYITRRVGVDSAEMSA
jgi:hypothetical protein